MKKQKKMNPAVLQSALAVYLGSKLSNLLFTYNDLYLVLEIVKQLEKQTRSALYVSYSIYRSYINKGIGKVVYKKMLSRRIRFLIRFLYLLRQARSYFDQNLHDKLYEVSKIVINYETFFPARLWRIFGLPPPLLMHKKKVKLKKEGVYPVTVFN